MANEKRVRSGGVTGKLSADIAIGGVSMQSAALADLPAVDSTNHAAITLFQTDANGRVTKREIVYVTAHTAGATTATIAKGKEGTTDQTWNGTSAPDSFVHAPTVRDDAGGKVAYSQRTSGDVNVTSTTYVNFDTTTDLTLTGCYAGDVVEVSVIGEWYAAGAAYGIIDVVSVVSSSPVNSWAFDAAPVDTQYGVNAWIGFPSTLSNACGGVMRRITAADLSGTTLTLRVRVRQDTAGQTKTLGANASNSFKFQAKNHGPQVA